MSRHHEHPDRHDHHGDPVPQWALELMDQINQTETRIMAAIDDLKAVMNDLINEAVTDLEALIAKLATPGTTEADLAALAAQGRTAIQKLKDEFAAATATTSLK